MIINLCFIISLRTHSECQLPLAGVCLLQQSGQLQDGDLALLMADCQVLPLAVRGAQAAHGHPPQHVRGDELADRLALVAGVVHAHILEGAFLGTEGGSLEVKY